jgi:signal transduction histidine kinase
MAIPSSVYAVSEDGASYYPFKEVVLREITMLEPPTSRASVAPASAEPLPPEIDMTTPGVVIVVDDAGRLRDRSPRAMNDPEIGALVTGAIVPQTIVESAEARRLVHEGSAIDALWIARGEAAVAGGLGERDFGAMLHRLRNVVGILVASLDAEDMIGSGPASTSVGTTRRREMDRLVDSLGALAHAFAPTGARSYVDLELVLRRAIDGLRGGAQRRNVTLRLDGVRHARRARTGDQGLLEAGLAALVANAIDATPGGGEVSVRVEGSTAALTITIEDDGPGLLKPTRGELGHPFASSKRGGVGLGLCVARRAAFVHGGELRVATRDRGTGVGATLWIPVAAT